MADPKAGPTGSKKATKRKKSDPETTAMASAVEILDPMDDVGRKHVAGVIEQLVRMDDDTRKAVLSHVNSMGSCSEDGRARVTRYLAGRYGQPPPKQG